MNDHDHPKSPATSLIDKLPGALLGLLMAGVVWILAEIGRPMLDAIAKVSTTQFLVRVILLLVAVLLLAFAYILSLRSQIRKPLSSGYDFDRDWGYYVDRKTGIPVCARCLADGIVTHLKRHAPVLMNCTVCKAAYVNNRAPQPKPAA